MTDKNACASKNDIDNNYIDIDIICCFNDLTNKQLERTASGCS